MMGDSDELETAINRPHMEARGPVPMPFGQVDQSRSEKPRLGNKRKETALLPYFNEGYQRREKRWLVG